MKRILFAFMLLIGGMQLNAQTVFQRISTSPDHTLLTAALAQEGLDAVLNDENGSFTVFAPNDAAILALAEDLGLDIAGVLALESLSDILTYHVIPSEVPSSAVTNGAIVDAVSPTNTLKLTRTVDDDIFVNQAQVNGADLDATNGVVHSINSVLLPSETVTDIAIDNGFTSLVAAVVEARLLPVLTNPFASLTVFAPTNDAFDAAATALGTDINGLLALPNLADILTYHVLGSEVMSSMVTNGLIVDPVSTTNSLKFTVSEDMSEYFVNQAPINLDLIDIASDNGVVHVIEEVVLPSETVVDIALDNGFTSLATAVVTARLLPALTNPFASYTVFAPTNDAFEAAATALGTDINGLLALPNLADILTYHVLGSEVMSSGVTNGLIVDPLSTTNSLKFTVSEDMTEYFVNQAPINLDLIDITSDNGVVHVIEGVVLPSETVVDVALDNGFTSLATAVVTARLLPALTNPFATLTVFAPSNEAFEAAATALGTDINGLLALENLADILTYHVLGSQVMAADITETQIIEPLSMTNTLKVTLNAASEVFVNQAQVTLTDVMADNGVVHVLNGVVLPVETVVDVAIDNDFTSLTGYVIAADLLPALTNPFASLTVFAPTNEAFALVPAATIEALESDIALLTDVLLYHVVGSAALSTDLNDGDMLPTLLDGQSLDVTIAGMDVTINESNVTLANLEVANGVVHVIDAVLVPEALSINDNNAVEGLNVYPNPSKDFAFAEFSLSNSELTTIRISDISGKTVYSKNANLAPGIHRLELPVRELTSGMYILEINTSKASSVSKLSVK